MKQLTALLVLCTLCISLCACQAVDAADTAPETTEASTEVTTEATTVPETTEDTEPYRWTFSQDELLGNGSGCAMDSNDAVE